MPPHGHGGDEEEEVIVVRTDGPPFVDLKAKQGRGFEADFDKVQKYLGPGKISLADFTRDLDAINKAYIPTAHRSYIWLQIALACLFGSFIVLIVMGIIGGDHAIRQIILAICAVVFILGMIVFVYSKWIEQGGIKEGAMAAKKALDEIVNPNYIDSPNKIRWTIAVHIQAKKTLHLGKQFLERPVISIYALRSANAEGVLTDWTLPDAILNSIYVNDSHIHKNEQLP